MDLAVQKAIRARLIASISVTALVPPEAILDRHRHPAPTPSIILGEAQVLDENTSIARRHGRVIHTIHVWSKEDSLEGVKEILAAMRMVLRFGRLDLGPGLHAGDSLISQTRAFRDPDGERSHGVMTIEVLVAEVAP